MIPASDGKFYSSYSQLSMYEKCPFNWYLKYVEKIPIDTNKHLEYGLAIHEALEYYFNSLKNGQPLPIEEVKGFLEDVIDMHQIPFDNEAEAMEWTLEGMIMLEQLYNDNYEFSSFIHKSQILGVEEEFAIELDGVIIRGFWDLAGRYKDATKTDSGLYVVDNKSGGKAFDNSKLKHDLQFPIYAIGMEQMYGAIPDVGIYNHTRIHGTQRVPITKDRVEEAKERILDIFSQMKRKTHRAKPTPLCFWCDYGKYHQAVCHNSSDYHK